MKLYKWTLSALLGASIILYACTKDNSGAHSTQVPYEAKQAIATASPINYGILNIDGKEYSIDMNDGRNILHEEIMSAHFSDPAKVNKEYLVLFLKRKKTGDYAMAILEKRDGILIGRRFISKPDPFFKSDPPFSTRVDFLDYNKDGKIDLAIQYKTWFEGYRESINTVIYDMQSFDMLLNQVSTGKDLRFKDY